MTTLVAKRFVQATLTGSAVAVYTAPSGGSNLGAILRDIQLCNFSGVDTPAYIYIGSTAVNANLIVPGTTVAGTPGATNPIFYRQLFFIPAGEKIWAYAGTTGRIAMQASGVECSGAWSNGATPKRLVNVDLPVSTAAHYTCNAARAILKDLILANHDSSTRTVTIDIVKSGGAVGNDSKLLYTYSVAAAAQAQFRLSLAIENGDKVQAHCDSATKVAMNLSGVEFAA